MYGYLEKKLLFQASTRAIMKIPNTLSHDSPSRVLTTYVLELCEIRRTVLVCIVAAGGLLKH